MTTGEGLAIAGGVAGLGLVGYLMLKHAPTPPPPGATVAPAPTPAAKPAIVQLANGLRSLSTAGCAAIAGSKGVPSSLAKGACSTYTKYVNPLGLSTVAVHAVEKIPIVGGAVKKVENAVSTVVSKPINAVGHFLGSLF